MEMESKSSCAFLFQQMRSSNAQMSAGQDKGLTPPARTNQPRLSALRSTDKKPLTPAKMLIHSSHSRSDYRTRFSQSLSIKTKLCR